MIERTILDYNKKHYLNLTNLNDKDYIDLKLKIKNHYVVIIDNKNDIFETVYINDVLYSDDIKKIILNVDQLSIKISNLFSISNSFRFITGCYKEFNIDFLSDRYSFVVLDTNEYINVCTPTGLDIQRGTSFAAPWISRLSIAS